MRFKFFEAMTTTILALHSGSTRRIESSLIWKKICSERKEKKKKKIRDLEHSSVLATKLQSATRKLVNSFPENL
jgi:hypothetical protein